MTPGEDAELRRRVDGLFVSYGEVMGAWGKVDTRVDGLSKQIEKGLSDLKEDLKEIDDECKTWHNEYRRDKKQELEGRVSNKTIVIALIGGSATVLASIIAAATVILTGGH